MIRKKYKEAFMNKSYKKRVKIHSELKFARVKWVGYDSSYNSWIPESDIINYGDN